MRDRVSEREKERKKEKERERRLTLILNLVSYQPREKIKQLKDEQIEL